MATPQEKIVEWARKVAYKMEHQSAENWTKELNEVTYYLNEIDYTED